MWFWVKWVVLWAFTQPVKKHASLFAKELVRDLRRNSKQWEVSRYNDWVLVRSVGNFEIRFRDDFSVWDGDYELVDHIDTIDRWTIETYALPIYHRLAKLRDKADEEMIRKERKKEEPNKLKYQHKAIDRLQEN